MSKKDYQNLAWALHQAAVAGSYSVRDASSEDPYFRGMCDANVRTWEKVADVLAADNPRFDRARFIEACETGACKGMPKRVA